MSSGISIPDNLPGEDRNFGTGLFVDLIPSSCWFTNVRSCVSARDWKVIRDMVTSRADNRCEACDETPNADNSVKLAVHERWEYDNQTHTQILRRLICLCTECHNATHFGRAQMYGGGADAAAHIMKVNHWSEEMTRENIDNSFQVWRARCEVDWSLDLSILTSAGITTIAPPSAAKRREIAAATLDAKTRK